MATSRRRFLAAAAAAVATACTDQPTRSDGPAAPAPTRPVPSASPPAPGRVGATAPSGSGLDGKPAQVVFAGSRTRPQVALTFHLSGDPILVSQLLDTAAHAGMPISLFAVGRWLTEHPTLVRRILAEGHELDNHTWSHPVLGRLTGPAVAAEIRRCQAALTRATGSGGRYFRPSGMTRPTPLVLAEAGAAGYPLVVSFDVDPRDYADPGTDAVATRVAAGLRPGSIVSLHTGHAGTVAAFDPILAAVRARGLQLVLLHQLLSEGRARPEALQGLHSLARLDKERRSLVISYLQAIVIGLLQGVTELFPVSSLGHSVLVPALLGWDAVLRDQSAQESPYLAFLVGLHVATALALLVFFRAEWARVVRGLVRSLRRRQVETPDERLGWLLVVATIPAGIIGLAFEHTLRILFAKPLAAAVFLTVNGLILLVGEYLRRRPGEVHWSGGPRADDLAPALGQVRTEPARRLATLTVPGALLIGSAQILAFFAGISRSGTTMVAGLIQGLDHEDAARFSFLLATPIILAAGVYKLPDLLGPNGDGVRGQALAGSAVAAVAAYLSVRFLTRWFTTRTLIPFAAYCLVVGLACIVRFA